MTKFAYMAPSSCANFNLLHKVGGKDFFTKAAPIMEAIGLATLPATMLPMFMESKDVSALKSVRNEDKKRMVMGLPPLSMTPSVQKKINALPQ